MHQRTKSTNIEVAFASALREKGYTFDEQVPICNASVVDFFIPSINAVVFCDGDYWHNLPEHIEKDKRVTATIEAGGYRVFRFWGSEILNDVQSCVLRIDCQS